VREHNRRVRDTGKVGKEPDDSICKHKNRHRGLCVDCESVVPMPARRKTTPPETVAKYQAIMDRKVAEEAARSEKRIRARIQDPDGRLWIK
jgi:hypothetical protein